MDDEDKSDLPPMAERRPVPRRRVLLGGLTVHELGRCTVNCQIRDLNENGARIAISRRQNLPQDLYLIITKNHKAYKARLIWRKGDEAGLAFLKCEDLRAISDPALSYLSQILARQNTVCLSWR
jgi:PilZ domain